MRSLMRIALVCACVCLWCVRGRCAAESGGGVHDLDKGRSAAPDASRRDAGVAGAEAGRRNSQLLALAAARRRKLFAERLHQHAALPALERIRNITLSAQPDLNANASVMKTGTDTQHHLLVNSLTPLDVNSSRKQQQDSNNKTALPTKLYQDSRNRSGFLNNLRKGEGTAEGGGAERGEMEEEKEEEEEEAEIDPNEEFQVDESNHGIYFLNFTDIGNVTAVNTKNQTKAKQPSRAEIRALNKTEFENIKINRDKSIDELNMHSANGITNVTKYIEINEIQVTPSVIALNKRFENESFPDSTSSKENKKENVNKTQFMSDEIYNHFRPLESELRAEDMAQFLSFGQKLSSLTFDIITTTEPALPVAISKTTDSPSQAPDKNKFTARYSAANRSRVAANINEENANEVTSVAKDLIEKKQNRYSVKGPVPARHISLLNAYRKPLIATHNAGNNTIKEINITLKDTSSRFNNKNQSRAYLSQRRRPLRPSANTISSTTLTTPSSETAAAQTDDMLQTTKNISAQVYTAVVTSVSITSSMKGQNKTVVANDSLKEYGDNILPSSAPNILSESGNETESTSTIVPSILKQRGKVQIRSDFFLLPSTRSPTSVTENDKQLVPTLHTISTQENTPDSLPNIIQTRGDFDEEELKTNSSSSDGQKLSLDGILVINTSNSEKPKVLKPNISITEPDRTANFPKRKRPTLTPVSITQLTVESLLEPDVFNKKVLTTVEELYTTPFSLLTAKRSSVSENDILINPQETSTERYSNSDDDIGEEYKANNTILFKNPIESAVEEVVKANSEVVVEAERSYTASYALAGLGLLPVAAIMAFAFRHVLLRRTKQFDTEYGGCFEEDEVKKNTSPPLPPARQPLNLTPLKPDHKWEFPRNKLRLQTLLGQGNFGQVWKAEADDLSGHAGLTRLVAVKRIKDEATAQEKQELLREICIMQRLGAHPNVVTLLACCTEQEPYLLVMEYVMCGKLLAYLRERRMRPDRFGGGAALSSRDLTVFAYCVARGMEYLASKKIVHRDLAARNILVDHNKLCKIADFGMSRELGECGGGGEGGAGPARQRHALPVRWMAPEALLYSVFSHETDVWAFGVLLWEIVTLGSTPYAAMSGREVLHVVTEGYRLERPPHCKPALYRAMHACWSAAPAARPRFPELKAQLAELLEREPAEGHYVDLDSFYKDSSVYSDPSAILPDDAVSLEYTPPRRRSARLRLSVSAAGQHARARDHAPLASRHSFSDGVGRQNGRVPEFECDI